MKNIIKVLGEFFSIFWFMTLFMGVIAHADCIDSFNEAESHIKSADDYSKFHNRNVLNFEACSKSEVDSDLNNSTRTTEGPKTCKTYSTSTGTITYCNK